MRIYHPPEPILDVRMFVQYFRFCPPALYFCYQGQQLSYQCLWFWSHQSSCRVKNIARNNLRSSLVSLVILELLILAVRSSGFITERMLELEWHMSTMKKTVEIYQNYYMQRLNNLSKFCRGVTSHYIIRKLTA